MARKDVVRFLVRLFGDPKLHGKYRRDPKKVAKAAGLDRNERALLASGDEKAIRDYLGGEAVKANVVRSGLAPLERAAAPNVVKSALANVVKASIANVVKSSVANIVKTAVRRPSKPKPKPKPKKG